MHQYIYASVEFESKEVFIPKYSLRYRHNWLLIEFSQALQHIQTKATFAAISTENTDFLISKIEKIRST